MNSPFTGGEASHQYRLWRTQIIHCMAHIAAYIDFGEDEGIESDTVDDAMKQV